MADPHSAQHGDTELMRAVVGGDRLAVAELYDRYAGAVYGMAMSLLRDEGAAQDVSQETFVRLWTRAQIFDAERGTALGWLVSIARNLALDELRAQRRRSERTDRFVRETGVHERSRAAAFVQWDWESQHVLEAVVELSSRQRETVELVYLQGFTLAEVADRLDVAIGTVKSRLHSALLNLRAALAESSRSTGPAAEMRRA